jgi:peptidyl-prolyl cis-trans isomerase D
MLRFLRAGGKHTKAIWWLLTIVTVFTFVLGFNFFFGVGTDFGRGGRRGMRGLVDGLPISEQEYQAALASQREAFRRQYGSDPADRDEKSVQMQTWRSLVTQRILAREARKEGIQVHDPEVILSLQTTPPQELVSQPVFQTDGKFDPDKYRAALRDPNSAFWAPFEELTRVQLPVRKLNERLMSSIKLSEPEMRETYHERFDRVSATVVVVSPDGQAKVPRPQPADLDRVYREHKGRFNAGPRVDLELVVVPKKYSDEDLRTARQFAQSLVDRARQGEDFAQLARDYSEGPGASQGGVINRVVQPSELGPELGPRVSGFQPGQVSDPFPASGRFIVIKVLERVPQPGQPEQGLRLAQIIVRARPSEEALQSQYAELQKLRARALALKSLGKAAAEKGLGTTRTGFLGLNDTPRGLEGEPEAADWAFGAKQGSVSPIFEGVDEFAIVQVATRHVGGPVPRDLLAETLGQIAEVEARVDRAKPTADRLAQALAQGRPLEEAAKEVGLTPFTAKDMTRARPDSRLVMAPELIGALFAATPGKTLGPVREPAGWFFARLDEKAVAPTDSTYEKAKASLLSDILGARQRSFFGDWLGDLRMKTRVQDLRYQASR